MEATENRFLLTTRMWFERTYVFCLLLFAFVAYPMGALPPAMQFSDGSAFNNLSFEVSFSACLFLGFLAVPVILLNRWRAHWAVLGAGVIFLLALLPRLAWKETEFVDEYMAMFAYVTIPFATAILVRKGNLLNLKTLSYAALAIWVHQVILGYIAVHRNSQVTGTAGNINWMAALLLCISPLVFMALRDLFTKLGQSWSITVILASVVGCLLLLAVGKSLWRFPYVVALLGVVALFFLSKRVQRLDGVLGKLKADLPQAWAAAGVVFVLTFPLLERCYSRAAWWALFCVPAALLMCYLRTALEKCLLAVFFAVLLVGGVAIGYKLIPGKLLRVVEQDVRLPLWSGTVAMMVKQPLGVGPGEFQREFAPLRKNSTYHSRLFAADMTIHPHNEILNVGAQLGWFGALAFVVLLCTIFRSGFNDPLLVCARLGAFTVFFQSLFDMPIVQPPTSFLALTLLGLCLPLRVIESKSLRLVPLRVVFGCALIVVAAYVVAIDFLQDVRMRSARLKKHVGKQLAAVKRKDEANAQYKAAFEIYRRSATPIDSMKANYEAGLLALNMGDIEVADDFLVKVAAVDPNFAHLNLLRGQIEQRKRNFEAARVYFARECQYFPRRPSAWQNMYSFAVGTRRYDQGLHVEALLRNIYLEKARLTFPGDKLDAKRTVYLDALKRMKTKRSIELAKDFMNKINHRFTDPLYFEFTVTRGWPEFLTKESFNDLDYFFWRYRYQQGELLNSSPADKSFPAFVDWFTRTYQIVPKTELMLPPVVMIRRKAEAMPTYLLLASMIDQMGGRCIIELNAQGNPVSAVALMGPVKDSVTKDKKGVKVAYDYSKIRYHRIDLQKKQCKELTRKQLDATFKWVPKRTIMYFAMEEFYLRNAILGAILHESSSFLPNRPPSTRMIETFYITGQKAPPVPLLKNYVYQGAFELYDRQFNLQKKKAVKEPAK